MHYWHFPPVASILFFDVFSICGGIVPYGQTFLFEWLLCGLEFGMIIVMFSGFLHAMVNIETREQGCFLYMAVFAIPTFWCKHLMIRYFRCPLREFTHQVRHMHPDFIGKEAATIAEETFHKFSKKICILVSAGFLSLIFCTLCLTNLVEIDYANPNNYTVKYWHVCLDSAENTTSWGLPCFHIDNNVEFAIINLIMIFLWIPQQTISMSVLLFFTYIRQYLEAHVKVTRNQLKRLFRKIMIIGRQDCGRTSSIRRNNDQKRREFELQTDVKNIIRYYQFFCRYIIRLKVGILRTILSSEQSKSCVILRLNCKNFICNLMELKVGTRL